MKKFISALLAALMIIGAIPLTALAENGDDARYKIHETISVFGVIYDDGTGDVFYFNDEEEPYEVVADEDSTKSATMGFEISLTAQEIHKNIGDWATEMGVSKTDRTEDCRIKTPPLPTFSRSTDSDPDKRYYDFQLTDIKFNELITRYDEAIIVFEGHRYTEPEPQPEPLTGWQYIDGNWYYYNADGEMQTGWVYDGGKWYFLKSDGVMATGWVQSGGKWYFMSSSGAMTTGWVQSGGKWYFMSSSGAMQTGWVKSGGKWYYMNSSGAMATGWVKSGSKWYFMSSSGAMATGWVKSGGKWYYMDASGAMLANTSKKIGNKTYKFNASGVCTNP